MLKEMRCIEYTLEILRTLHHNPGRHDSVAIFTKVESGGRLQAVSKSYVQKVLPRLVRIGLLGSNETGYTMVKPLDEVTVDMVLNIVDMPTKDDPLYSLCDGMKQGVSLTTIDEFYDFSR
jgi:DNA-binding IscR family transcriptional regulator